MPPTPAPGPLPGLLGGTRRDPRRGPRATEVAELVRCTWVCPTLR